LETEAVNVFRYVECVVVTEAAADQYAFIKAESQTRGTPLDENDLWIAATALSLNATLVSSDADFKRIAALKVESWD
jgi:tRNA(fMet)-specific endonuclease VapC